MAVCKVQRRGRVVWRARVVVGGKSATAYRSRKDEAVEAEAELRARLQTDEHAGAGAAPSPSPREVPTLATFAGVFMETYAKTNNRPSTAREKQRCLNRGILPALGDLRLDAIGPEQIERYKAMRLRPRDGRVLSPKTVNEEIGLLAKILRVAQEWGKIDRVPPFRRLKVPPPDFDFLDFDEADRLAAAATHAPDPWHAMVPTALLTGLRLGELRGLQWDDVDLVARRLHVRHAADDVDDLHPPKSGRARIVDLPRTAVAVLQTHKHLRGSFVFCLEDGSILPRWRCESKAVKGRDDGPLAKICRKAGLRRIGWHALRHTYASHLVMRGANLNEVQELLGHASITMTMRYAHLSPARRRAAVDLLDRDPRGVTTGVTTGGRDR